MTNKNILEKLIEKQKLGDQVKKALTEDIREQLQVEVYKVLDADKKLQDALKELESCTDLTADEDGLYQYIRFSIDEIGCEDTLPDHNEIDWLVELYLSEEHNVYIDKTNDCLVMNIGPALLVVDSYRDGFYLYDQESEKHVQDLDKNMSESEINELIKEYQESQGVFHSIVNVDGHGNYFYRSLTSEVKS